MNGRRSKAMQKLFVAALIVSVCTSAIMAQESAKAGFSGIQSNLRFESLVTSKLSTASLLIRAAPQARPEVGLNVGDVGGAVVVLMSRSMAAIHSCFST